MKQIVLTPAFFQLVATLTSHIERETVLLWLVELSKDPYFRPVTDLEIDGDTIPNHQFERLYYQVRETLKFKPLKPKEYVAEVQAVIEYLNLKANRDYKSTTKEYATLIRSRLGEGYSVDQLKEVVDMKVSEWANDAKMYAYLRPDTLFNKTKFEGYVNAIRSKPIPPAGAGAASRTGELTDRFRNLKESTITGLDSSGRG